MSKDVTHNPWVFDTVDTHEGWANRAGTPTPIYKSKPFVDFIVFETNGTDGDFKVTDASSGNDLSGTIRVGSTNGQVQIAVGKYVDGIYITTIPASGKIYVYHGQEA